MFPQNSSDISGWVGVCAILLAYVLVNFQLLQSHDTVYQLLNGIGAIGVVVAARSKKDYPTVALNTVWAVVAIIALLLSVRK